MLPLRLNRHLPFAFVILFSYVNCLIDAGVAVGLPLRLSEFKALICFFCLCNAVVWRCSPVDTKYFESTRPGCGDSVGRRVIHRQEEIRALDFFFYGRAFTSGHLQPKSRRLIFSGHIDRDLRDRATRTWCE